MMGEKEEGDPNAGAASAVASSEEMAEAASLSDDGSGVDGGGGSREDAGLAGTADGGVDDSSSSSSSSSSSGSSSSSNADQDEDENEDQDQVTADDGIVPAVPNPNMPRVKYKIARKRASMLMSIITDEQVAEGKRQKPKVFDVDFRVGDSVELEYASSTDTKTRTISKIRGVLLGIRNKGIATSIIIRDVVMDDVVERDVPLHNPLILSIKVLTRNFVKGKQGKKIRRKKLYYLRNRPDSEVRVTG